MSIRHRTRADSDHNGFLCLVHRADHTRSRCFRLAHAKDHRPAHPVHHWRLFARSGATRHDDDDVVAVEGECEQDIRFGMQETLADKA